MSNVRALTAQITALTAERDALREALDGVLVGGNHLALHIGANHPASKESADMALEHYGAGIRYDVWCCWEAIMQARAALTQKGEG